ncbi:hypothetical protein [Rhodococcoides fascians]|uniref:hypothetical protein n=1 Tax=Rhodococcoides fascians TaxID=1828 RepID=UPI000563CC76|nr:hypothetical protein [Rhodococcus fascians]
MKPVEYELTGVDGSRWPFGRLGDPTTKLRLAKIEGLGGAAFKHEDVQNVDEHGVTWNSTMYEPNLIVMHVRSQLFPGDLAVEVEKAFRRAVGRGKTLGRFDVRSRRFDGPIQTRFEEWRSGQTLPSPDYARTHYLGCFEYEGVTLRSDESWWRTEPYVKQFTNAQFSGATVLNVSDEDVWPHFQLRGPITTPTLGLHGEAVPLPSIGSGQTWNIETDPDWFEIRDHLGIERSAIGRRWYKRAKASDPSNPVPVPVTITGSGTGPETRLTVTLPQLYHEAS